MTAARDLARRLADLERRLKSVERSSQVAFRSFDDVNGNAVTIPDAIAAAQTTADGKSSAYWQGTPPTGGVYAVGDLWFDTANGYRISKWDGATWVLAQFDTAAFAAGSVTASVLDAGAVTAGKIAAGAIDAFTITGATIQTYDGNVVLDDEGFHAFDPATGDPTVTILSSGAAEFAGAITGGLIAIAPSTGTNFDDTFSAYTVGTLPTSNWTRTGTSSDSQWSVKSVSGSVSGKAFRFAAGGSYAPLSTGWRPTSEGSVLNAEAYAEFQMNATPGVYETVNLIEARGNASAPYALTVYQGFFGGPVFEVTGPNGTVVSVGGITPTANTWYKAKLRIVGTSIFVKVWEASASEPKRWSASAVDSANEVAGYWGLSVGQNSLMGGNTSWTVDWAEYKVTPIVGAFSVDSTGNLFMGGSDFSTAPFAVAADGTVRFGASNGNHVVPNPGGFEAVTSSGAGKTLYLNTTNNGLVKIGGGGLTVTGGGADITGGLTVHNGPVFIEQTIASHRILVLQANPGGNSSLYLDVTNPSGSRVADISSSGNVQGTGAYTNLSDASAKADVAYLSTGGLAAIQRLRPATFRYHDHPEAHRGFVAQDVQGVIPEAVVPFGDETDGRLGLRSEAIVATLVLAVQELAARLPATPKA